MLALRTAAPRPPNGVRGRHLERLLRASTQQVLRTFTAKKREVEISEQVKDHIMDSYAENYEALVKGRELGATKTTISVDAGEYTINISEALEWFEAISPGEHFEVLSLHFGEADPELSFSGEIAEEYAGLVTDSWRKLLQVRQNPALFEPDEATNLATKLINDLMNYAGISEKQA